MMNRLNATSCPCSLRLSELTLMAEAWWNRMHLAADDWGTFPANPRILKGKLWPLRDEMTPEIIQDLLNEYTETGLVHQFTHKGENYGFFLGWFEHQKIRYMSARIYPAPPESEISFKINHKINSKGEKVERFGSDCIEVCVHCTIKERTRSAHRLPVTVTVTETVIVTETGTELKESGYQKTAAALPTSEKPVESVENTIEPEVEQETPKKPKKEKPIKTEAQTVKSPACCAYRDVFHLWPNRTQEEKMNELIVGEEDVEKWSQVCRNWALHGNKPTNVEGMLDWYQTGIPNYKPGNGKDQNSAKVAGTIKTLADRIKQHQMAIHTPGSEVKTGGR